MIIRSLLLFLILSACAHVAPKVSQPARQVVAGCQIFDSDGHVLRRFAGGRCVFFGDGRYVMATNEELKLIDANNQVVWTRKLRTHHILTLTTDGDLLVGTSEIKSYLGKLVRFDVLLRVGMDGSEKGRFSLYDHRSEFLAGDKDPEGKLLRANKWAKSEFPDVHFEFSHLNSYYEIPEHEGAANFHAGDILANTLFPHLTVFVLDPSLKRVKLLKQFEPAEHFYQVHDVQMLKNGHLLWYNNLQLISNNWHEAFSTLDEVDPVTWKVDWRFTDSPPQKFFSATCGGVQLLSDNTVFFSDLSAGIVRVRQIDRASHELRNAKLEIPDGDGIQDAKLVDLSKFLSANQAP